jgi:peptidoglycan/LPS O-acetylase OafA/YrhL
MRRIDSFEGLRGLLALWVLFGHVIGLAGFGSDWRGPFRVMVSGGHAVDVFVILSGFVIFLLIDRAREPYPVFIWRRFWRLFPAFAVCCTVMLALTPVVAEALADWPLTHPLNASRLRIMHDTLAHMGWQIIVHVPMLHGLVPHSLLPNSSFAILGQAWSISLEWQFYLLAPALFAALYGGTLTRLAAIGLAVLLHFAVAGWDGLITRHIPYFAVGIASYFLWSIPQRPSLRGALPVMAALAYLTTHDPALVIWAVVFAAVYLPEDSFSRPVNTILSCSPVRWLGQVSYSIYLFHIIAMYAAMLVVGGVGWTDRPLLALLALMVITLPLTLIGAAMLHRWVEQPGIAIGKLVRAPRRAAAS